MKKRKNLLRAAAGFAAALLMLSLPVLMGVGASAAEADGYRMKFTGGSLAGEKLHLSLEMTGKESFGGLELLFEYDETQLTLKSYKAGDALSGVMTMANATVPGELRVAAITVNDVTPNGEVYQADFEVADGVESGVDLQVSLVVRDIITNDKAYGPSKGLILVDTLTAGDELAQGEFPQRETVSRADPSTLPGNGGASGNTSGSTSSSYWSFTASMEPPVRYESGETDSHDSSVGAQNTVGRWLLPAVIALGVAALAAVLVIFVRPKQKDESGTARIVYQQDPTPVLPRKDGDAAPPAEGEEKKPEDDRS